MNDHEYFPGVLKKRVSRRQFFKVCLTGLMSLVSMDIFARKAPAEPASVSGRAKRAIKGDYDLVAVKGDKPYEITVKAIALMGGMGKFVRKNDVVVIKPNIGWDRTPEQAANTNPDVVAALVDLCFEAGAKRVNVFDVPCNDARRCYENSGIQRAASARGATVSFPNDWDVVRAHFDYQSPMEGWPIMRDAMECDTFINVPVMKHHGLTGLTLSMKNLMGVCGGNRGHIHSNIGRKLVDLTDFISPELTVIDAYRFLTRNGPTGGNVADVAKIGTVFAATDPTLADAYACKLVNKDPTSIPSLQSAIDRGFGNAAIDTARIHTADIVS